MTENNITIPQIIEKLKAKNRIIIISHIRPDGDTLACAFSLKYTLMKMGKKVICVSSDPVADRLAFLCDDKLYLPDEIPADFDADLVVSVDVASTSMLGNCKNLISLAESIKIDHHHGEDAFADYNYTKPESASCSEIIYDIITQMTELDDHLCNLLYAGISFDTGCFKHSNVTSETHAKASYLVSRGVNTSLINQNLFGNKSSKEIEALKMAYNSLEFFEDGKIAVICITNQMREEKGLSEDDIADLAQIPIDIKGVLIGTVLKEKGDCPNNFKVSMRSRPGIDASEACRKLNGGGHTCAAGGLIVAEGKEEAIAKLLDAAIPQIK